MTTIYLVLMTYGCHEDQVCKTLAAFSSMAKAAAYIAPKNEALHRLHGKNDAIASLLLDWDKSHPMPELGGGSDYGPKKEEYETWRDERFGLYAKLNNTLKLADEAEASGLPRHDWDSVAYHIEETTLDPES